jgi:hypothetical protein
MNMMHFCAFASFSFVFGVLMVGTVLFMNNLIGLFWNGYCMKYKILRWNLVQAFKIIFSEMILEFLEFQRCLLLNY